MECLTLLEHIFKCEALIQDIYKTFLKTWYKISVISSSYTITTSTSNIISWNSVSEFLICSLLRSSVLTKVRTTSTNQSQKGFRLSQKRFKTKTATWRFPAQTFGYTFSRVLHRFYIFRCFRWSSDWLIHYNLPPQGPGLALLEMLLPSPQFSRWTLTPPPPPQI